MRVAAIWQTTHSIETKMSTQTKYVKLTMDSLLMGTYLAFKAVWQID